MRRAAAALIVLALAACSSKASTVASTTSTAPIATTTTAPPTTTTTSVPSYAPSAEQAAAALIKAWQSGDRAGAGRAATAAAVDALFARPSMALQGRGCSQNQCVYRYGSGLLRLTATKSPPGFLVTAAAYEG